MPQNREGLDDGDTSVNHGGELARKYHFVFEFDAGVTMQKATEAEPLPLSGLPALNQYGGEAAVHEVSGGGRLIKGYNRALLNNALFIAGGVGKTGHTILGLLAKFLPPSLGPE